MIALKGSEKQIKWAEEIRKEIITRLENSNIDCKEEILNSTINCEESVYFINHREEFLNHQLQLEEIFSNAIRFYNRKKINKG